MSIVKLDLNLDVFFESTGVRRLALLVDPATDTIQGTYILPDSVKADLNHDMEGYADGFHTMEVADCPIEVDYQILPAERDNGLHRRLEIHSCKLWCENYLDHDNRLADYLMESEG